MFAFTIALLAHAFMNAHVHELFINVFVYVALARTDAFMNSAVHERVRKRLFTSVTSSTSTPDFTVKRPNHFTFLLYSKFYIKTLFYIKMLKNFHIFIILQ